MHGVMILAERERERVRSSITEWVSTCTHARLPIRLRSGVVHLQLAIQKDRRAWRRAWQDILEANTIAGCAVRVEELRVPGDDLWKPRKELCVSFPGARPSLAGVARRRHRAKRPRVPSRDPLEPLGPPLK